MMTDVRIGHLRKRYRMPADAVSERSRLDRVLQSAFDDELFDAALERAGVPASEEICVRRMDSVVRLDRSQPDARLAVAWSVALADAIAQRLRDGGPDVVRYRTRHVAIVDMACSATRGDVGRAWAWRSLGIWRADDAVDARTARTEVIAALTREPRLAPCVLAALARRALLPLLVEDVPVERWVTLARATLREFGASAAELNDAFGETSLKGSAAITDEGAVGAAVLRIASSELARVPDAVRIAARPGGWVVTQAIAAMALLETEPSLATSVNVAEIVLRVAHQLSGARGEGSGERREVASQRDAASGPHAKADARASAGERRRTDSADSEDAPSDALSADVAVRAATSWGGLLFLLNIANALDLPTILLRDAALGARSVRWSLHQMALQLAPIAASDPAALAFAGQVPTSRPPSEGEPPATDTEVAAIREMCDTILAELRARMQATADEGDAALLERVAKRSAEIIAEPAWIEIRLATAELSTGVRRAGLDLDPGWMPWLGVVVRFAYV